MNKTVFVNQATTVKSIGICWLVNGYEHSLGLS